MVSVQAAADASETTCTILLDGDVVDTRTASGPYQIVVCMA